jgi:hypothetical protein
VVNYFGLSGIVAYLYLTIQAIMTLEQIDLRLQSYKDYLPILLNEKYPHPVNIDKFGVMNTPRYLYNVYKETGMLLLLASRPSSGIPISFGKFLCTQGKKELLTERELLFV